MLIKSIYNVDVMADSIKSKKEEVNTSSSLDYSSIITSAANEIVEAINNMEVDVPVTLNTENILKKMDDLIVAVTRLGNLEMQVLEELHKTNSHLLKTNINDRRK